MANGRPQHRPRYVCTALNAAGRPVPMFDSSLGEAEAKVPAEAQGPVEGALFGPREDTASGEFYDCGDAMLADVSQRMPPGTGN
ncbi:hypothetical protein [Ensifer sp. LCM 4579]|uniref:hypothetical protein n=1 Tax=Ensifer sp. LCM 4579 TaxID=1848292 RepID=UPI0008D9F0AD|nr:hypothetical protein [Ensifer sp. LCM 4579]OHV77846.1 hypothetical protein LCM4579_05640 [Ensifer sp. LCM 4579]